MCEVFEVFFDWVFIYFSNYLFSQNIIVKPYLQDVTSSSTKVMFETNLPENAEVIFGFNPFELNNVATTTFQIGNGDSRIHTALLSGLLPGQKYYYKVNLANGVTSLVYHFTTLQNQTDEENITFVAVSDMQRQSNRPNIFSDLINYGIIPIVNQEIDGGLDRLQGILVPGDLVQNGGNYNEWKNTFFNPSESITPYVPLYPVLGNHEYYNGGQNNFLKYFDLPINGSNGYLEQWWYKDFSNLRVIGLNSNTPIGQQTLQLEWLQTVINEVCQDMFIDFVFVQLHHPYKSELWTPGELNFTGLVIEKLEEFTQNCGKPSVHFFGHTHGYSRGQSKQHQHLWVNVATAGGAIDYWGQYPNHDYEEYSQSEDEYGFVLIEANAGPDPQIKLKRYSRGDDNNSKNNEITDEIIMKRNEFAPKKPKAIFPFGTLPFQCVVLKASQFDDPDNEHQASHWQVATDANFVSISKDIWKQNKNLYNDIDTQAGDDLTDDIVSNLLPSTIYYWRVRYRDNFLMWSDWSDTLQFSTEAAMISPNLLLNNGAEDGIVGWNGQIESLTTNECGSVPVYQGTRFFAVGGVCINEQNLGLAEQWINLVPYATDIDNGVYSLTYAGYLRSFATSNDLPEIGIEFYNNINQLTFSSSFIGNSTPQWLMISNTVEVPPLTRRLRFVLKGTRLTGVDNDSYFDELSARLITTAECNTCFGTTNIDLDNDGFCSDLDCDDNDPTVYPGALEVCDSKDNNCDNLVDAGAVVSWTGLGDGINWENGDNWNQNFVPLPCQHVIIDLQDTIVINSNPVVKSLFLGSAASLYVESAAELKINSQNSTDYTSVVVDGNIMVFGKIEVINSITDGIKIFGLLQNYGRIYINDVLTASIIADESGILENAGLIKTKN